MGYYAFTISEINVVYLWNPTTSYVGFKVIPLMDRYCLGFGFDPNSGDFKVVNSRYVKNESGMKALIAEVYSMSRGSWIVSNSINAM
jgi:hypothetical protein